LLLDISAITLAFAKFCFSPEIDCLPICGPGIELTVKAN